VSSVELEALLARIYVDDAIRAEFLKAPERFALRNGLSIGDAHALACIDRVGLAMAARSFAHKRAANVAPCNRKWINGVIQKVRVLGSKMKYD